MDTMTRKALLVLAAVAVPLVASACEDEDPLGPEDVEFDASLGVDLDQMERLPTGVYIQTIQPGFGSEMVEASDTISFDYKFWLPSGTLVQEDVIEALEIWRLIPGFQDGVIGMVEGEIRLMVIPPERGYGSDPPNPAIPADAILVYRVELLEIVHGEMPPPG
jgi:FKBP-type peptidyl-prolyl cis-trans isomerase